MTIRSIGTILGGSLLAIASTTATHAKDGIAVANYGSNTLKARNTKNGSKTFKSENFLKGPIPQPTKLQLKR